MSACACVDELYVSQDLCQGKVCNSCHLDYRLHCVIQNRLVAVIVRSWRCDSPNPRVTCTTLSPACQSMPCCVQCKLNVLEVLIAHPFKGFGQLHVENSSQNLSSPSLSLLGTTGQPVALALRPTHARWQRVYHLNATPGAFYAAAACSTEADGTI